MRQHISAMPKLIKDLKLDIDHDLDEHLAWLEPNYSTYRILKKSVDARKRGRPHFVYSLEVFGQSESSLHKPLVLEKANYHGPPVLIIGSGPAGLFAAVRLVERGIPCLLFEQGSDCVTRLKAINRFWRYGEFDPRNNVGFGEGGAGLYSDGKLITRIKSPHIPYVMERLVQFGAPEEILYLSNPHVGSDRIRRVIPQLRQYLLQNGCQIFFNSKITKILESNKHVTGLELADGRLFHSPHVILACGHSADELFHHLHELGVFMEGKSFAVGLRIEHPQKMINQIQYRDFAEHPKLGSANYRLAHHDKKSNIGVYSFCMCPGGYVLSSSTDNKGVVSNGMSNYHRNSAFANAAVVVSVDFKKYFNDDLFGGLNFRNELEHRALNLVREHGGTKQLPAQRVVDFLNKKVTSVESSSCPSGILATPLHELLPQSINESLKVGLEKFEHTMKGFIHDSAIFHGVESRTSCPLRITRDAESLQSLSHSGLYPCGEGAGYAGGITSAACDGVLAAEAIFAAVSSQKTAQV